MSHVNKCSRLTTTFLKNYLEPELQRRFHHCEEFSTVIFSGSSCCNYYKILSSVSSTVKLETSRIPATGRRQTRKTNTNGNVKTRSTAKHVTKPKPKTKNTKVTKSRMSSTKVVRNKKPIYDALGYEIDPVKVAKAKRRPRQLSPDSYMKMLDDDRREDDRKAEIMGTRRDEVSAMTMMAWEDRVAQELGKPYHKVVMENFEEVHRRGIRFHPDEFVAAKCRQKKKRG